MAKGGEEGEKRGKLVRRRPKTNGEKKKGRSKREKTAKTGGKRGWGVGEDAGEGWLEVGGGVKRRWGGGWGGEGGVARRGCGARAVRAANQPTKQRGKTALFFQRQVDSSPPQRAPHTLRTPRQARRRRLLPHRPSSPTLVCEWKRNGKWGCCCCCCCGVVLFRCISMASLSFHSISPFFSSSFRFLDPSCCCCCWSFTSSIHHLHHPSQLARALWRAPTNRSLDPAPLEFSLGNRRPAHAAPIAPTLGEAWPLRAPTAPLPATHEPAPPRAAPRRSLVVALLAAVHHAVAARGGSWRRGGQRRVG